MGKVHALILVFLILLSIAPSVRADLPSSTRGGALEYVSAPPTRGSDATEDSKFVSRCSCLSEQGVFWPQPASGWLDEFFLHPGGAGGSEVAPQAAQSACEIPALPGSASLFLSAMLSLGAWQLVRSARQFDFGVFPEWYHSGGPFQVGHAVAFDLDFHALPLCFIASNAEQSGTPILRYRVGREERAPRERRSYLRASAPRAPPAVL